MKSLLTFFITLIISIPLFSQQTRLVPQDYASIQAALNASQGGDLILVSPGVYFENIVWNENKDGVELKSTNGPENTIIDANQSGRPLFFDGNLEIDNTTIIDGFTLRNGFINAETANGGGVYINEASPILRNLIIENNKISSNRANGAGIRFDESLSRVENCIIQNNELESTGWGYGAGVFLDESNVEFYNCKILNNSSVSSSWSFGGGLYITETDAQFFNCIIAGNSTDGLWGYGGGMHISGGFSFLEMIFDVDFTGCTITNNKTDGNWQGGSAIDAEYSLNLNIINSIIYNNEASPSALVLENTVESNISYSVIEGGHKGAGNIGSDPLLFSNEILIPTENSPCLNAGNRNITSDIDILGNERPYPRGSAPDIGAYEINQNFAYVLSRFFYDENQNAIHDAGEAFIGRGAITVNDNKVQENIDADGVFTFVEQGTNKINFNYNNTGYWGLSTSVSEYTFDVVEEDFADTIYFGIFPGKEYKQLITGIYSPPLRCSRTIIMEFFVKNEGTTREDGVLWAKLDPLTSEIMPLKTPDFIEDDKYGWSFNNLLPGESFTQYIEFKVPGVLDVEQGQLLKFTSEATVNDNPNCIATFCFEDDVRCSYDPNDKLINPNREDQLLLRDQDVTYTIRFQNVGNDYADDVYVVDTLDSNFDYSTFKLMKTSHPDQLSYTLSTNGILRFDFPKIYLPDSTTNEPGSNGFIMYSIRLDSTLANFIDVKNTAHIYFDFNPAIVTNTTNNTVVDQFPVGTKEEEALTIGIYPNPSTGKFNLPFEFDRVEILDQNGKFIRTISNVSKFDLSDAIDGVYYIRAIKDADVYLEQVVLIRN